MNDTDTPPPTAPASRRRAPRRDRQRLRHRFAQLLHAAEERAAGSPGRHVQVSFYVLRIMVQLVRQWARDRCPQQAASLAFQTVLSVVPILAVCLAALRATGLMEAESTFVRFMTERFIPVSRGELSAKLQEWSAHITFQSMGLVGLISIVLIAFVMFFNLERVINHIWRSERRRSLGQKFVVFYATVTIGPLLLGVSLYQAAQYGLVEGPGGFLLSIGSSFLALLLANYFLPATRVRLGPALLGAGLTTALFEGAKFLFTVYVSQFAFERYSGIYGAVAVLPIWLIWIYYSWLMLLLGVEVAHAAQNIRLLERSERRGMLSLESELVQRVNGPTAARIMVAVAEAYLGRDKTLSRQKIGDRFDLSPDAIDRLVRRLKAADLLMEVEGDYAGFIPARPPAEITLAEVLTAFRGDDRDLGRVRHSRLAQVLGDVEAGALERTAHVTLDQLVELAVSAPAGARVRVTEDRPFDPDR